MIVCFATRNAECSVILSRGTTFRGGVGLVPPVQVSAVLCVSRISLVQIPDKIELYRGSESPNLDEPAHNVETEISRISLFLGPFCKWSRVEETAKGISKNVVDKGRLFALSLLLTC